MLVCQSLPPPLCLEDGPCRSAPFEQDAHERDALLPAGEVKVILAYESEYVEDGVERLSLFLGEIGQILVEIGQRVGEPGSCC